jgi:phosphoglycolate phosphatase-like HAD superfamily hydrolase
MKKYIHLTILSLAVSAYVFCQPPNGGSAVRNIQGLKIEFITRQLKLALEDAGFWPVYYSYMDELAKARKEQTDDLIANEEKILEIRKRYRPEFKQILVSDDRVLKVFQIERDFNALLRAELDKRAQQKGSQ